jgi:metal-responsive CopG/Arc/MetJ family transcriptional regulator
MAVSEGRSRVEITLPNELLKKVDANAKKCGMSRVKFIETFMEITLESSHPEIDFGIALGRLAKFIWPKSKRKS